MLSASRSPPSWFPRRSLHPRRRQRFFNVVDLVNKLEAGGRSGRQGRSPIPTRKDFVILDELGYLPFAQSGGQLLFHLISRLYEQTFGDRHDQSRLRRMAECIRRIPR